MKQGVHERKFQFKKHVSAAYILKVAERQMILLFGAGGAAGSLVGLQGCEPRTFCQLAQQPWQEVSLQIWWSHSNRKHSPPPPPPPSPTDSHCFCPCRKYWKMTVVIYVASLSSPQGTRAVSSFPLSVTSVRKLNWVQTSQDVMSAHHARICMRIILCRCTAQQSSRFRAAFSQHIWDSLTSVRAQVAEWGLQSTESHFHKQNV